MSEASAYAFARAAATPADRATLQSHSRAVRRRALSLKSSHVAGTTRSFRGGMTRAEEEMQAPRGRKTCSHAPRGANCSLSPALTLTHSHSLSLSKTLIQRRPHKRFLHQFDTPARPRGRWAPAKRERCSAASRTRPHPSSFPAPRLQAAAPCSSPWAAGAPRQQM